MKIERIYLHVHVVRGWVPYVKNFITHRLERLQVTPQDCRRCPHCQAWFAGLGVKLVFCSETCAWDAYRLREEVKRELLEARV